MAEANLTTIPVGTRIRAVTINSSIKNRSNAGYVGTFLGIDTYVVSQSNNSSKLYVALRAKTNGPWSEAANGSQVRIWVTVGSTNGTINVYQVDKNFSFASTGNADSDIASGTITIPHTSGGTQTVVLHARICRAGVYDATATSAWHNLPDIPVAATKYKMTFNTSTGVSSFTGSGSYTSGSTVSATATASAHYHLTKYVGTNTSGDQQTWTGCAGKTTHTDSWTAARDRTITAYAELDKYYVDYNPTSNVVGGDIYINGSLVGSNVQDYYHMQPYGTTWKMVAKPATGYHIRDGATRSGTVTGTVGITFYADPNTYTVTYNSNGGAGSMPASTATYNAAFRTKKNAFSRNGYTFAGWNEAANGTGTAWNIGSQGVYESGKDWTWTYAKNITLYAQWTPDTSIIPNLYISDWKRDANNQIIITMQVSNAGTTSSISWNVDNGSTTYSYSIGSNSAVRTVTLTLPITNIPLASAHSLKFWITNSNNNNIGTTYLQIPKFEGGSIEFKNTTSLETHSLIEGPELRFMKGGTVVCKELVEVSETAPIMTSSQMRVSKLIEKG